VAWAGIFHKEESKGCPMLKLNKENVEPMKDEAYSIPKMK
jgi:hypothetical protein